MDTIEKIFGMYFSSLLNESRRFVKIKALTFYIEFLKGSRRMTLTLFYAAVAAMLVAAGIFLLSIQLIFQIQEVGFLYVDMVMIFGVTMIVVGGLFLTWALSEKRLLSAFGVNKYLESIQSYQSSLTSSESNYKTNHHELSKLVDVLVEEKISQMVEDSIKKHETSREPPIKSVSVEDDAPNIQHIRDHTSKSGTKIEIH